MSKFLSALACLFFTSVLVMASASSVVAEKELSVISTKTLMYGFLGYKIVR